tara:strand:+ start:542 stop:1030 length:489 start_codon:yes stop_codon:yes gene_type:complete
MTIYLGLGTNLSERKDNLEEAIRLLKEYVEPIRTSSIYETDPWGHTDQPDFLNCVLKASTELSPELLLKAVKKVEKEIGRKENFLYGPRLIDIDILFQEDQIVNQSDLTIPHAKIAERAFVLVPMNELEPKLNHPTLNVSIKELFNEVKDKGGVRLWGEPLL